MKEKRLSGIVRSKVPFVSLLSFIAATLLAGGVFVSLASATTGTGPNLVITSPAVNQYIRGTFDVTWTVASTTSLTNVSLLYAPSGASYLNLVTLASPSSNGSYEWNTSSQTNGQYSIKLSDSAGEDSGTPVLFSIDNTPSVTTLTTTGTPDTNGWYNIANQPADITLTCDDSTTGGSGCSSISYEWVDASTGSVVVPFATSTTASVTIDAGKIPQGDNNLVYYSEDQAVDESGAHNVEAPKTSEFKVDTQAPSIASYTLDNKAADAYFNPSVPDASTTIALTASEPVTWTSIQFNGSSDYGQENIDSSFDGTQNATVTWNGDLHGAGKAQDGSYQIQVHIEDIAGNESTQTLTPYNIIVDTQAPGVTVSSPTSNAIETSSNFLTFTPSDTGGTGNTPIMCSYAIDGLATSSPSSCTNNVSVTPSLSNVGNGPHTVTVVVTDAAGNSITSAPVSFIYSNNQTLTVSNQPSDGADFPTIGAAVAASDAANLSGETIDVLPGSGPYTENITLDKPFTIEGAQHGTDARGRTGAETVVDGTFTITSDNVTLDGLTINDPAGGKAIVMGGNSNETIENNIIDNNGYVATFSGSNITFSQNAITNEADSQSGIEANSNPGSNFSFDNNSFTGVVPTADITVIGDKAPITSTVAVTGNTDDSGNTLIALFNTQTASITDNNVSGGTETSSAIYIGGNVSTTKINGNTVSGASTAVNIANDYSDGPNSGIIIGDTTAGDSNTFDNNGYGIKVGASSISGLEIHENEIAHNTTYNVENDSDQTVDATNNYWGTALYSAVAATMHQNPGTILFQPYYVDKVGGILSSTMVDEVFVNPSYTDGNAGTHIFGYDAFSTIQDAVDAPALKDGGTVHVADGTYDEDVNVDRSITLESDNGAATTIIDGQGTGSIEAAVKITADNVTLGGSNSGFTVDGAGGSAVYISGAHTGVNITDDTVNAASGMNALLTDGGQQNMTLSDNTFGGSASQMVYINGTASVNNASSNVNFTDNTFGGSATGPLLGEEADSSTISGNTFTGASTYADLEVFGASDTIVNNTLTGTGAGTGIVLHSSAGGATVGGSSLADRNTISGFATGITTDGVGSFGFNSITGNTSGMANTGASVNAEKNWWGDATGPQNASTNPNGLGNAVSNMVDYSPFCTDEACDAFGSTDPIASISVIADPTTLDTGNLSTVTVTGKDADGTTVVNDTSTQVRFSADHGASLGSLYAHFGIDGTTSTTVTNSVAGVVNVGAEVVGASPAITGSTQVTFNQGPVVDTTPPSISNIQAVALGASSEKITWSTDEPGTSQVEYGGTSGYGTLSTLDSTPATSHSVTLNGLTSSTEYHFRVASADASHNLASSTDNTFTTAVDNSSAALAVTGIDAVHTFATPDDTFKDGWSWTFHITAPESENEFAMKFSDFTSGTSVIPAADNIRYYTSASSAHADEANAVTIAGAGAYPASITLDGADLDPNTPGKQIEVTVEVKVPTTANGGSYSASYGVKTDSSPF